jgi:dihydropyrimidinase
MVDIASTSPAKIFGMYPEKGTVAIGSDADLVVWDPNKRFSLSHQNLHMKADYAAYEGKEVTGAPRTVLSRGEVIIDQGKQIGRSGRGRFVRRKTR